jgi:hypothetical protein
MAGKDRTPILCADGKGSPVPRLFITSIHLLRSMYPSRSLPLYIRKAPFRRDTYTSSIMSSLSFVISSSYDASIEPPTRYQGESAVPTSRQKARHESFIELDRCNMMIMVIVETRKANVHASS